MDKTITVSEETWKWLMREKIDFGYSSIEEVIINLKKENVLKVQ
jgi:predicted CopG family antitoxin